jgi:hypothetical protein
MWCMVAESIKNCFKNVNHYFAIYLLILSSLSDFRRHILLQPGESAAVIFDGKGCKKNTLMIVYLWS